jgi:hypothetical protein
MEKKKVVTISTRRTVSGFVPASLGMFPAKARSRPVREEAFARMPPPEKQPHRGTRPGFDEFLSCLGVSFRIHDAAGLTENHNLETDGEQRDGESGDRFGHPEESTTDDDPESPPCGRIETRIGGQKGGESCREQTEQKFQERPTGMKFKMAENSPLLGSRIRPRNP